MAKKTVIGSYEWCLDMAELGIKESHTDTRSLIRKDADDEESAAEAEGMVDGKNDEPECFSDEEEEDMRRLDELIRALEEM